MNLLQSTPTRTFSFMETSTFLNIEWADPMPLTDSTAETKKFIDVFLNVNLTQIVSEPIRVARDISLTF